MAGGLLAILSKAKGSKDKKGESDYAGMGEDEGSSPDMEGDEKKDAMRDFLDAVKEDDAGAASMALERFVVCCHED